MYSVGIEIKSGGKVAAQYQSKPIDGEEPAIRFTDKWKNDCTSVENMLGYIERTFWFQKGGLMDVLDIENMKNYRAFRSKVISTFRSIKPIQEFTVRVDCDGDVFKNTFKF